MTTEQLEKYPEQKAFTKWLISKGFHKIDSSTIQEQYILFTQSDAFGAMKMNHSLYDLGLYLYAEQGSELTDFFDEVYDLDKFVRLRNW
jgi:beta-galactosidase GanA